MTTLAQRTWVLSSHPHTASGLQWATILQRGPDDATMLSSVAASMLVPAIIAAGAVCVALIAIVTLPAIMCNGYDKGAERRPLCNVKQPPGWVLQTAALLAVTVAVLVLHGWWRSEANTLMQAEVRKLGASVRPTHTPHGNGITQAHTLCISNAQSAQLWTTATQRRSARPAQFVALGNLWINLQDESPHVLQPAAAALSSGQPWGAPAPGPHYSLTPGGASWLSASVPWLARAVYMVQCTTNTA